MNKLFLAAAAISPLIAASCATTVSTTDAPNLPLYNAGPRVPLKACFVPDNYTSMLAGRRTAVGNFISRAGSVFQTERAFFGTPLDADCDVKLILGTNSPKVSAYSARSGRGLFEMKGSFGFDAYPKMHQALVSKFSEPGLVASLQAERGPVDVPGAGKGRLGLAVGTSKTGTLIVASVEPGTPASEAGLKAGDEIVSIGDQGVQTMTLAQATILLRGEPGTTVGFAYKRGDEDPKTVVLTRREIAIPGAAQTAAVSAPVNREPLSDVDSPTRRGDERPNDFALVIGIDEYQNVPRADWGVRDAKTMRRTLEALGFEPRNVVLLTGQQATAGKLKSYLEEWLPLNVKPNSTLFVYYSGHGAPDPKTGDAYLVPWDGDPKFLKSTALPLSSVYASLAKTKAKKIVVALDACFSGAGGRSVLAAGARPLVAKAADAAPASPVMTILAAASGDEITGALPDQGHGLFTYHLLKTLGANPQADAKAIFAAVKPKVQDDARRENREQTPVLIGPDGPLLP